MKKSFLLITLSIIIVSCRTKNQKENPSSNQDKNFENYKNNFSEQIWLIYPYSGWKQWLSYEYHKLDTLLIIPNKQSRENQILFAKANLDSLKTFDLSNLSSENKTDYYLIENELTRALWAVNEQKIYEWDPSIYNVADGFATILNEDYESLDTRLRHFYIRMASISAYYEAAKKNIKNPTHEHTQLAIDQNKGGISVFENDLPKALAISHLAEKEKQQIHVRAKEAIKTMTDFANWLKALKNETPRSFRLGKELYTKKFEFDIQSSYTIDEVYEKTLSRKKEIHREMATLANQLWKKYMGQKPKPTDQLKLIREVIDQISLNHVQADSFQISIEKQIPILIDFVKKKDLIYINPSKPLIVRKEPAYMAGVVDVSVSAPSPYDKNGNTYYNVGSLSDWTKERSESYLREYNMYTLQILNIHEAIPGHYTQLVYSNQSPSIIKSILGNTAMVEGWAVYTERMMLENGYGNNEPEMWLMYYKWHLRVVCNTILDYSVHVKNMTKEEALHLLIDEAFQQKAEAEGKWKRVMLTQVQLCSYYTGYTEIYSFREELKNKLKAQFNLKKFHEQFLNYGNTPVKYIRKMMIEK